MSVRSAVVDAFSKVAREHAKELPALTDSMPLLETGLDSLCFAVIVTRLEDSLGIDPFAAEDSLFPMTFGEFVQLYEGVPTKLSTKNRADVATDDDVSFSISSNAGS